jgi:hypothetical protein
VVWQLRTYRIRPGMMDEFRSFWAEHVVPAREALGFTVRGGWFDADDDVFVWIVGHPAPDGYEAAERAYQSHPRRGDFPRDPREFVSEFTSRLMQAA